MKVTVDGRRTVTAGGRGRGREGDREAGWATTLERAGEGGRRVETVHQQHIDVCMHISPAALTMDGDRPFSRGRRPRRATGQRARNGWAVKWSNALANLRGHTRATADRQAGWQQPRSGGASSTDAIPVSMQAARPRDRRGGESFAGRPCSAALSLQATPSPPDPPETIRQANRHGRSSLEA